MIFTRCFSGHGHTRTLTIEHAACGWIACEQDDSSTRTSVIRDWGHVEMAMAIFDLKASGLRDEGGREISTSA